MDINKDKNLKIDLDDPIFKKLNINTIEDLTQEKLDEIGRILTEKRNSTPIDDFEGYSPMQMQYLIYNPFDPDSPLQINPNIDDSALDKIYLLPPLEYLISQIKEQSFFKLTEKGNIPPKHVKHITGMYAGEDRFYIRTLKVVKENDSIITQLLHIFLELSGIVKKRKNILTITKSGQSIISDRVTLLKKMIEIIGLRLHRGYFDAYGNNEVGQIAFGFIFALVLKYGNDWQHVNFYAEKYFKAFPLLYGQAKTGFSSHSTPEEQSNSCFNLRMFDRFMVLFNFLDVQVDKKDLLERNKYIKKSDIFDKIFILK
jgi:hypothetical protein